MNKKFKIRIYTCAKMTGRDKKEMVETALHNKKIFEAYGIEVLDPILEEHVKPVKGILIDTPVSLLKDYWKRDKQMIREAHVIVDTTPEMKSEGSSHEIGLARYGYWKPIVRMYSPNALPVSMIVYFEDDLVVHSPEEAAIQIQKFWGSWFKRFLWRIALYYRCFFKHCYYKLTFWFQ